MNFTPILFNLLIYLSGASAGLSDYINSIGTYMGWKKGENAHENVEIYERKIPYEVPAIDEKFISEAAKLTGIALSDLDHCHQRVIIKLQSECDKLNEEDIAKLAVHLLNCQSHVEGRKLFPCGDEMSIKACTQDMDPDTWTSYHLMTNRVKSVCYTTRQVQFRGLAEHTVNRLMETSRQQLKTLDKINTNQNKLKNIAENTIEMITKGNEELGKQQDNLQKAQFHGQLVIEDNIKKLLDEKKLIVETEMQLTDLSNEIINKLELSLNQLQTQTDESRINHKKLIEDLVFLQKKTHEIFKKIDESSSVLIKQNEEFKHQYISTLEGLQEVNSTVHNLVSIVNNIQQFLEEKIMWITSSLGGTDQAVEKIYLIILHVTFIFVAMLTCAFLSARVSTRLIIAVLPPVNLAVALLYGEQYLDLLSLTGAVAGLIIGEYLLMFALNFKTENKDLPLIEDKPSSTKKESTPVTSTSKEVEEEIKEYESPDTFNDFTPPVSRNSYYSFMTRSRSKSSTPLRINTSLKSPCLAKTRTGNFCKLNAMAGRDFCFRHQTGDSVMG